MTLLFPFPLLVVPSRYFINLSLIDLFGVPTKFIKEFTQKKEFGKILKFFLYRGLSGTFTESVKNPEITENYSIKNIYKFLIKAKLFSIFLIKVVSITKKKFKNVFTNFFQFLLLLPFWFFKKINFLNVV